MATLGCQRRRGWRRGWSAVGALAGLLALCGAVWAVPGPQAPAGVDPAYVNGYAAGYQAGNADRAQGAAANPHKFYAYQTADGGYQTADGDRVTYASSFRSGFDDGYTDGYQGRPASVGGEAKSALAAGRGIGYREGYTAGEFDSGRNAQYGYADNAEYRRAAAGYSPAMGGFAPYQAEFRQGFREGYEDGYHHHLYNSAIGVRSDAEIPGTVNPPPPPAGLLPTNPEVARALASGNYSNGTLVSEGTIIQTRLDTTISTKANRAGDPFRATVTVPVWVGNKSVIPAGSTITGTVEQIRRGGHFSGNAEIQLRFDAMHLPGGVDYPLHARVNGVGEGAVNNNVNPNEGTIQRDGQGGQAARKVATSGGFGAIFGAIFGGGRGALLGGAAGAAVGTAGVLLGRKRDLKLFTGEAMAVRLSRPLLLRATNP
ncbi:MAG: hypothetical protein ACRD2E_11695 [Terriglobales bacterium]